MTYASKTEVSVEKTVAEIRTTLVRYKASSFGQFEEPGAAMIAFELQHRRIIFRLPLPRQDDKQFILNGRRQTRSFAQRIEAWEQACRSRWRALFLCIKAKLESVESGIETFEDAFMAHIQMPDGTMFGDVARPAIAKSYESGLPPMLTGPRKDNGQ